MKTAAWFCSENRPPYNRLVKHSHLIKLEITFSHAVTSCLIDLAKFFVFKHVHQACYNLTNKLSNRLPDLSMPVTSSQTSNGDYFHAHFEFLSTRNLLLHLQILQLINVKINSSNSYYIIVQPLIGPGLYLSLVTSGCSKNCCVKQ